MSPVGSTFLTAYLGECSGRFTGGILYVVLQAYGPLWEAHSFQASK
jgi:hypothetical protein